MNKSIKTTQVGTFIVCCATICTFLVGCAKYKVQHIAKQEKVTNIFEKQTDEVDLTVLAFDQEEFKNYLTNYQPLHLRIKNKTAQPIQLAARDISLQLETLETLKKKDPKIFAVNFLPCILTSALGLFFWWEIILPSILVLGAGAWQQSILQHERAQKYLATYTLFPNKSVTIDPFSERDVLIFVKRSLYTPKFTATFTNLTTKTSTLFNVFITARTSHVYRVS